MMPIDPLKPIKTFHCAIHINISIYIFQCKATYGAWNSIASTACHTGSPPLLLTPHCGRTCDGRRDQVLNIIGAVVSSIISPVQCPHLATLASAVTSQLWTGGAQCWLWVCLYFQLLTLSLQLQRNMKWCWNEMRKWWKVEVRKLEATANF